MCGGFAKDDWEKLPVKQCEDIDGGEDERCQGPSRYPPGKNEEGDNIYNNPQPTTQRVYQSTYQGYIPVSAADVKVSGGQAVCYNYQPGESFEKNFGLGGDGVCKTEGAISYYCDGDGGCTATSLDGG